MYRKIIRDRALNLRGKLQAVLDGHSSQDSSKAHEVYDLLGKEKVDQKIFSEIRRMVTARIAVLDGMIAKV